MPIYKAIKAGTLSDPYRYVHKGETVESKKPINCKWLVPVDKYRDVELPLTATMVAQQADISKRPPAAPHLPPVVDPSYDRALKSILAKEAIENNLANPDNKESDSVNGGEPSNESSLPATTEPDEEKTGGTGDQEVL